MKHGKPDRPPPSRARLSLVDALSRRGIICAACLAIVVITIILLAEPVLPVVVFRLIVDGGLCLVWLAAAVGWGAVVQRLAKYQIGINLLDFVNSAALGIGLLSLIVLGLGLGGWLNRITAWALVGIGIAPLLVTLGKRAFDWPSAKEWFAEPSPWSWLWIFAMPVLGIALVAAFVPPGILWGDEPHGYDVVEYHLQVPREWYEANRIVPLEHNVFSYMPMNVELHYLLAMHLRGGPWNGMYLAQLMHLSLTALSVLAVLALARDPAGPPAATVGALAMAVAPWLLLLAPIAYNEGGLLFFGAMSIGWAWRALRDPDQANWKCWALAGAFAGFACGTKLTAVPMLLIGIPAAAIVAQLISRSKIDLRSIGTFLITAIVTFSPWLIRNRIWAGNPVFPEAMSVLGRAHFTEDQQERWRRAHSPPESQRSISARLKASWEQIAIDWRYGYALLLAGAFGIAVVRRREAWFLLMLLSIFFVVWIAFTHLQSRFFVLAIPVAAIATASGLRAKPQLLVPAAINFAIFAVLGVMNIHFQYMMRDPIQTGRLTAMIEAKALGAEDLNPEEAASVSADLTLVLVGDAKAFFYSKPMTTLRYRTVFDVSPEGDQSIIDAWAGKNVPEGAVMLIDPVELQRMTQYWKIAAPPADVAGRRSAFLVPK
ncbi:MAG: glycosyltransferase family 39 protein [Anaerolineae bacterium]|nr:glycosyltransferase family 39 protein [Phycisphaerae bacterium]